MLTAVMKAKMAIPWLVELAIYQQGDIVTITLIQRYCYFIGEWFFSMFTICSSSILLFLIIHFPSMKSVFCFEDFTIYVCQRYFKDISTSSFFWCFWVFFLECSQNPQRLHYFGVFYPGPAPPDHGTSTDFCGLLTPRSDIPSDLLCRCLLSPLGVTLISFWSSDNYLPLWTLQFFELKSPKLIWIIICLMLLITQQS